MHKLLTHHQVQWILSAIIIVGTIFTKYFTINHWNETGLTGVYPSFMPWAFIVIGVALLIRLWYEHEIKLVSVWVIALATIWYGIEAFSVI